MHGCSPCNQVDLGKCTCNVPRAADQAAQTTLTTHVACAADVQLIKLHADSLVTVQLRKLTHTHTRTHAHTGVAKKNIDTQAVEVLPR